VNFLLVTLFGLATLKQIVTTSISTLCSKGIFIALGIIGVNALIAFHELGHFLFCKLFNIATPSFSIGLGPRILTKKIGGTEFALSLIPMGGYVEIAGYAEIGQGEQKSAHITDETAFNRKTFCQKLLVMLGGIIFNIVLAYAIFTGLFLTGIKAPFPLFGTPLSSTISVKPSNKSDSTIPLKTNDQIIGINGKIFNDDVAALVTTIEQSPDSIAQLQIIRDNTTMAIEVPISSRQINETQRGYIENVAFLRQDLEPQPFTSALIMGINLTHSLMKMAIEFFLTLPGKLASGFASKIAGQIAGPIGLVAMISSSASNGIAAFLTILALISINLAVVNFVPLPVFDGGQILLCTIEDLLNRQLPLKIKEAIFIFTWLLIISLMIFVSFNDIKSLLLMNK
jgi:regulator of sigma E protease